MSCGEPRACETRCAISTRRLRGWPTNRGTPDSLSPLLRLQLSSSHRRPGVLRLIRLSSATVALCVLGAGAAAQSQLTVILTGQSMIRSDLRATAPAAVMRMRALLKGDVVFTNLEAAVAEQGESVLQCRGFLGPPEALDALQALGFNLLALSGNHAFDLGPTGIGNTLRETRQRGIVHAGIGGNVAEASAPA